MNVPPRCAYDNNQTSADQSPGAQLPMRSNSSLHRLKLPFQLPSMSIFKALIILASCAVACVAQATEPASLIGSRC
jgi:hypothetical protein